MLPPLICPVYISRQGGGPVITTIEHFVLGAGVEPAQPHRLRDFKSLVYTNFTTRAYLPIQQYKDR